MTVTNPDSEFEALVHVAERLASRFPELDESAVRAMVIDELVDFDEAGLRDYIPVLVDGRVTRRLRASLRMGA